MSAQEDHFTFFHYLLFLAIVSGAPSHTIEIPYNTALKNKITRTNCVITLLLGTILLLGYKNRKLRRTVAKGEAVIQQIHSESATILELQKKIQARELTIFNLKSKKQILETALLKLQYDNDYKKNQLENTAKKCEILYTLTNSCIKKLLNSPDEKNICIFEDQTKNVPLYVLELGTERLATLTQEDQI
jgi:hypothetical protein